MVQEGMHGSGVQQLFVSLPLRVMQIDECAISATGVESTP
jgi:hypothetical protein